jgi:hypothetical protein
MTSRASDDRLISPAGLLAAAALLPVTACAASVAVYIEPGSWFDLSISTRQGLWRDALLYTAGAVVVAAPLAGVAVGNSRDGAARVGTRLAVTAGVTTLVSALLAVLVFNARDLAGLQFVGTSHITIFTVGFALAAFGAFCGTLFADALDAAACSVALVLFAAGGLLVAGASVSDWPIPLLDAAITASPLVAMTSAAHVDIARMAVPYQMSPLARLQVEYPTWYAASAWYLLFACLCLGGAQWKARSWRSTAAS